MAEIGADMPREIERVTLADDREVINALADRLLGVLEDLGYQRSAQFAIRLAYEEAVTNAFQHGHKGLQPGLTVTVAYGADKGLVWIEVEDQGPGFTPQAIPDPTLDENLDVPTGRGLMLMRAYMTNVHHNEKGNRVTLIYRVPAD